MSSSSSRFTFQVSALLDRLRLRLRRALRARDVRVRGDADLRALARAALAVDGVRADGDVAAEDRALVHDQLGRRQVALVAGGVLQLDAIVGGEVSVDLTLDEDRARLDVGLHPGFLGDVESAGAVDLAFELPLDPQPLLEAQLSLEAGIGPED